LNLGRHVHREHLMEALWPGAPRESAAHRLHAAASSVRQCLVRAGLGEEVLDRRGAGYALVLPGALLDVVEVENAAARAGRLLDNDEEAALELFTTAVAMYTGDLLPEAGPAEWVVADRDRLRAAAAGAAHEAARLAARMSRHPEAVRLARRAVELEPHRDTAWQLLSTSQELLGDKGAAAVTRRDHAALTRELELTW
jgi:two-component SAPR family response regulator